MEAETTLADELRQIARNLDRAASISAQYCASGHHTAAIRRAADELEALRETAGQLADLLAKGHSTRDAYVQMALGKLEAALAPRPAATPDPDRHHVTKGATP